MHAPVSAVVPRFAHAADSPIWAMQTLAGLPGMISFAGGYPDPALLPVDWVREAAQAVLASPALSLQYSVTEGLPALREACAQLLAGRGLRCDAADLLVTTGSQQGIDMLARVLLEPGDRVALETFNYPTALQTLRLAGAAFAPVASDADGMDVAALAAQLERPGHGIRAIYVVPSFANPTGAVLSLERRRALLVLAERHDLTVIEDDPYGELWFDAPPPSSLAALEQREPCGARVVHLASFSKLVAPALRLGVVLAPPDIRRAVFVAKQACDLHCATFEQAILAEMLRSGRLPAHAAALRRAYAGKARTLADALARHAAGRLEFDTPRGGMFLWARMTEARGDAGVAAWMDFGRRHRVLVMPGSVFTPDGRPEPRLRLSFSNADTDALAAGAQRLGEGLAALATA
jgi:DNA-binding transcriptional MocR family regulator